MKLLLWAVAAAVYLAVLWGPAFVVARQSQRTGQRAALRRLRLVCPAQLVSTFALLFAADSMGLAHPAGLFVAATALSSLAGAGVCMLLGWLGARRQRAPKIKRTSTGSIFPL